MDKNYLAFLEEHLNKIGNTLGLSDSEIVQIEMDYNVRLPLSYKHFLKQFGKSSGKILTSYLMTVDKMQLNRESALDASFDEIDNVKVEISDNYFFIGQWQGYNFYYLDCSIELEDPPHWRKRLACADSILVQVFSAAVTWTIVYSSLQTCNIINARQL